MLQPKKTKFRRQQKGRMKGLSQRGNQLAFGSFGIKTLENCWLTGRQIEAARQAVSRYMKREGKIWIRIFPDKPYTKKPAEVRMGKGKGIPVICNPNLQRMEVTATTKEMKISTFNTEGKCTNTHSITYKR